MVHQAVFVLVFVFATFVNGNPLRFEPSKRPPVILGKSINPVLLRCSLEFFKQLAVFSGCQRLELVQN